MKWYSLWPHSSFSMSTEVKQTEDGYNPIGKDDAVALAKEANLAAVQGTITSPAYIEALQNELRRLAELETMLFRDLISHSSILKDDDWIRKITASRLGSIDMDRKAILLELR